MPAVTLTAALIIGFGVSATGASAAPSYSQTPVGFGSGHLESPVQVSVDSSTASGDPSAGDVYVAEPGSEAVEKFSAAGDFVSTNTGSGTPQGSFLPRYVAVDPTTGDVFVADDYAHVIDKFDDAGNYLCQISAATSANGCVTSGPAPEGSFAPQGIGVDPANGNLYVVDNEHNVIDVFSASGTYVSQFGSSGAGNGEFAELYGDPAVDSDGNVYVEDDGNGGRVQEFDSSGHFVKVLDAAGSKSVAVDTSTDDVYVADLEPSSGATTINMYSPSGSLITSFGAYLGENGSQDSAIAENSHDGSVYVVAENSGAGYIFTEGSGGQCSATGTTERASGVSAFGATLMGSLNANRCPDISYWFEYGTGLSYGASTTSTSAGSGTTNESVSAALTGLTPNTTYHFRLVVSNGFTNFDGEDEPLTTKSIAPVTTTGKASSVDPGSVTLNGVVNPENSETTYYFQYGTSIAYGSETPVPVASAGSGLTGEPVSVSLSALTPGTTYHYRLVATNALGEIGYGADETFMTTLVPAPTTGGAGPVSQTTATVEGTLNPSGLETTYEFQYGTSTAYGFSTAGQSAGSGEGYERESANVVGLQPGMIYHFRIVITDSAGIIYGEDGTFTTYSVIPAGSSQALSVGQSGTELTSPASPPLLPALTPTRPAPSSMTSKPKTTTRAEKLSKALKQCKRYKNKAKRKSCDRSAHKRFGPKHKRYGPKHKAA